MTLAELVDSALEAIPSDDPRNTKRARVEPSKSGAVFGEMGP